MWHEDLRFLHPEASLEGATPHTSQACHDASCKMHAPVCTHCNKTDVADMWQDTFPLHWPLVNSDHMKTRLAKRELEKKKIEDDQLYACCAQGQLLSQSANLTLSGIHLQDCLFQPCTCSSIIVSRLYAASMH